MKAFLFLDVFAIWVIVAPKEGAVRPFLSHQKVATYRAATVVIDCAEIVDCISAVWIIAATIERSFRPLPITKVAGVATWANNAFRATFAFLGWVRKDVGSHLF